MEDGRERIQQQIEIYFEKCKALADYLTTHPEISGEEVNSCAYIVEFLKSQGYEVTTPYAGMPNSFLAVHKDRLNYEGKKAVLMCEYDALPEVGHACGHSLSCASSVLAGLAVNEAYKDLPIRVDLMGTPGEEFVGGKIIITDNGGFDGYEFAAMAHMNNENQAFFKVLASNDRYITFHGKASHASASPVEGRNALNAARIYMDAMDMWRQHITPDCQLHGIVEYGGDAPNVVPEKVTLDYYFRSATLDGLHDLNAKAERCVEGACMCTETTFEIEQRYPDYGEMFCNDFKAHFLQELFALTGRESIIPDKPAGSSDAGNVDVKIPVFHPMVDITNGHKEIVLHDKRFADLLQTPQAYQGMKDSALILSMLMYRMATEQELFDQIKKDHREYRHL